MPIHSRLLLAPLAGFLLVAAGAVPLHAAIITVTETADESDGSCLDGDCSLRDAIAVATTSDSISLPASATPYQVTLGELHVASNTTISGGGAATTIVQANGASRVLHLEGAISVHLNDLTITGGGTDPAGGGIFVDGATLVATRIVVRDNIVPDPGRGGGLEVSRGTLSMSFSTVSGNSASNGGGLAIDDSSFLIDSSTISGNTADDNSGGGLAVHTDGTVSSLGTINNSTISGNHADAANRVGGGLATFVEDPTSSILVVVSYSTIAFNSSAIGGNLYVDSGQVSFNSSIVSDAPSGGNCVLNPQNGGAINSTGYNIDDDGTCAFAGTGDSGLDPGLAALAANGGPTQTHAISNTSPAFDSADPARCGSAGNDVDQRGISRPQFNGCDRGAFELAAALPPMIAVPAVSPVGLIVLALLLALAGAGATWRSSRRAS